MASNDKCNYKEGPLPSCAPLALGTIPAQQSAVPAYDSDEALVRGTLFPGLDLPFMDYVSTGALPDTPLHELMALDFVCQELALYLNTHADDKEAFETWKSVKALADEGRRRYVERCGPVQRGETARFDSWVWAEDPWPWDMPGNGGRS